MPRKLLSPLQGFSTPTTQIPICLTPVSLPLLLLTPGVEPEDACAFIIIADTDDESRLSPITENKNVNMALLLLLSLFIAFLSPKRSKNHVLMISMTEKSRMSLTMTIS
jgi:hypothetical protein